MRDRVKERIGRQAFVHLPVYTGDVSGVCSALYEYGGMVVMHDPSGCNSTYNTHDEVRWDEKESLIFLSGLRESDAVLGNDDRLLHDVIDAAAKFQPAFLALCNSPIPHIIGTDFTALSRVIEEKTGIPTFYVSTNAMHDYTVGAGAALLALAKKCLKTPERRNTKAAKEREKCRVNILGLTPLDFAKRESAVTLRQNLEAEGFVVQTVWGIGGDFAGISDTIYGDVSLVISQTGFPLAKYLEEAYGIPYVAGLPIGRLQEVIATSLREAATKRNSQVVYTEQTVSKIAGEEKIRVIGESVFAGSFAAALTREGIPAKAMITTEHDPVLSGELMAPLGEKEQKTELEKAEIIIGDPLYLAITNRQTKCYRLPHLAFSGRLYRREEQDIFAASFWENLTNTVRDWSEHGPSNTI